MYAALDAEYNRPAADTFAQILRDKFLSALEEHLEYKNRVHSMVEVETLVESEADSIDALAVFKEKAIEALRNNHDLMEQIRGKGKPWGVILGFLAEELPKTIEEGERRKIANQLVRDALEQILGPRNEAWHTSQEENWNGKLITWVKIGKEE